MAAPFNAEAMVAALPRDGVGTFTPREPTARSTRTPLRVPALNSRPRAAACDALRRAVDLCSMTEAQERSAITEFVQGCALCRTGAVSVLISVLREAEKEEHRKLENSALLALRALLNTLECAGRIGRGAPDAAYLARVAFTQATEPDVMALLLRFVVNSPSRNVALGSFRILRILSVNVGMSSRSRPAPPPRRWRPS